MSLPPSIYDLTLPEWERVSAPLSPVHARSLWQALYRGDWNTANFAVPLQRWIGENFGAGRAFATELPSVVADVESADELTRKFLLRLRDGETIETVLMGYPGRYTACLSSQAGCAMGCVFCATGQAGFSRHLQPGEIVAQVLHARKALGGAPLRNLVLMGMGEPLHNYDAVMTALETISDTRGLNIGPGRITISTVGVVPGILQMARERRPYNLAVSLHGATEEERAALVPVSRRWPLDKLITACRAYVEMTGRRIFFAWTLIAGANDSAGHAERLAGLLAGLDAHVNLIPLNTTDGFAGEAASGDNVAAFQRVLRAAGVPSTVRQRRGIDVAAGCGQLRERATASR